MPKAILIVVVELGVFPFYTFRDNAAARRVAIVCTAVFAIAVAAVALPKGDVAVGLGTLAVLGGVLTVMVVADQRIAKNRRAEQARRAARRRRD